MSLVSEEEVVAATPEEMGASPAPTEKPAALRTTMQVPRSGLSPVTLGYDSDGVMYIGKSAFPEKEDQDRLIRALEAIRKTQF